MTHTQNSADQIRATQSRAVARSVARLVDKLGYDADVVFEGAIRGACAAMMARGASHDEVARLLENSGRFIRTLDQDNEA